MKILIQKIPLNESQSFVCRVYETPHFETNWHKHIEHELIVIKEGGGTALIGDYVSDYQPGDTFFLASNMPHWFRKHDPKSSGAALVIQFSQKIFGETLLNLPELAQIKSLLDEQKALLLKRPLQKIVVKMMEEIQSEIGLGRIVTLLQCLEKISNSEEYQVITEEFASVNSAIDSAIDTVVEFSFNHYLQNITLKQVATLANMSIPTFCRSFKKNVKKSYFDFLRDLRIGHACKLLANTSKPVLEICFESGYQSWPHFSKQFKHVKLMTPLKYRKQFLQ